MSAFPESNAMAFVALHFAKDYIVVHLRSSLSVQADRLYLRVGEKALPYAEFQRSIGDERARLLLVYPERLVARHQRQTLDADARRHRHLRDRAGAAGNPAAGAMTRHALRGETWPAGSRNSRFPDWFGPDSKRTAERPPVPLVNPELGMREFSGNRLSNAATSVAARRRCVMRWLQLAILGAALAGRRARARTSLTFCVARSSSASTP